jgi:hypothetical protein
VLERDREAQMSVFLFFSSLSACAVIVYVYVLRPLHIVEYN